MVAFFCIVSCKTTQPIPGFDRRDSEPVSLELTFAGDIMAHTVNYSMKDYRDIYSGIQPLLTADDLTFGNFEVPVAERLPLSTYPRFNVHLSYVRAAVEGGFDVFSLANNHANDQGVEGINGTIESMAALSIPPYSSGLKTSIDESIAPVVIEKKGWRILFLSVTEILNSYDSSGKRVYYIAPTKEARAAFLNEIAQMRAEHPCDLFVLSIHLNEPEYVRTVSDAKREWFKNLADAGVDIVWGHHPHVMQSWEQTSVPEAGGERPVLFMYSMGNFISGQRYTPEYDNPSALREYTGDAVLLRVTVSRSADASGPRLSVTPILVTNFTDPRRGEVVRLFDEAFINTLSAKWQIYYRQRNLLMRDYLPLLP